MLTFKDKLILFLHLIGGEDIFFPRRFLIGAFNSRPSSVDGYLRKLAREGGAELKGRGKGGKFRLKVSSKKIWDGEDFGLSRLGRQRRWDRLWRLVIFDISEQSRPLRDKIRRKLKILGFGMLQESVWITPYDLAGNISKFLSKEGLKGPVEVLEARRLFVKDEREMVARVWNLESLNREYKSLLEKETVSFDDWLKVSCRDPRLPEEILPVPWYATEALKRLREVYRRAVC